jgi:integrase
MPRRSKGPRLWLQKSRRRDDGTTERSVWIIRDGTTKRSTGFGPRQAIEAQRALADYILEKSHAPRTGNRDPANVKVADVISIYADDVAHRHARPKETAARLGRLLDFFDETTLAEVNRKTCMDYAQARGFAPSARRELEDLRSAIRHHWEAGLCSALTPVVLPGKGQARDRWLTRSEAARLLWAAWRLPRGRHVARFILVALYTGTRAGAICSAAVKPEPGRGWIDLDRGVFYRRQAGKAETKKRQPPVRVPPRLLAHARRWRDKRFARIAVVEWQGRAVKRINKAFRSACEAAGLGADVMPHTLRHTCATWLAQRGVPMWEAAGFVGMTVDTFERIYGHHHPDHQANAVNALGRSRQLTDRIGATEREQTGAKVVKLHANR